MSTQEFIQDGIDQLKAKKQIFTQHVYKGFHEMLSEPFKPEVNISTPFGIMRLKTRPASPNLVTIIYLDNERVYKILHEHLTGEEHPVINKFLDERLQRQSFDDQLNKVLARREMNNFRQSF